MYNLISRRWLGGDCSWKPETSHCPKSSEHCGLTVTWDCCTLLSIPVIGKFNMKLSPCLCFSIIHLYYMYFLLDALNIFHMVILHSLDKQAKNVKLYIMPCIYRPPRFPILYNPRAAQFCDSISNLKNKKISANKSFGIFSFPLEVRGKCRQL